MLHSFLGISNPVDLILGGLKDHLLGLYNTLVGYIEQGIIHPVRVSDSPELNGFYNQSFTMASYLAYLVFVMVIVMAALFFHKIERVGKAFVTIFAIAALAPVWQNIVHEMVTFSDSVTATIASLYDPPTGGSVGLPTVQDALGYVIGLSFTLAAGVGVVVFVSSFDLLVIFFAFWAPIAFSVSSFGKRALQFSNVVISVGLVAALFGRPFVAFFLEIGQILVFTFPFGKTPLGAFAYTIGSFAAAALSLIVLLVACYKAVVSVEGAVKSMASGTVNATIKNVAKVDVRKIMRGRSAGMKPMPVRVVNNQSFVKKTVKGGARHAVRTAGTAGSAAATAAGQPLLGAGIKVVADGVTHK